MVLALLVVDVFATCGGGGGGGTGGMGSNSMGADAVYQVPWKNIHLEDPLPKGGLVIYWFPASQNELEKSSLRNSRTLSIYATQCVTLGVSPSDSPLGQKVLADDKLPVAVLADTSGKVIGKAQGDKDGFLRVAQVEKLLDTEMKQRESAVKDALKAAKDSEKRSDKDDAIAKLKSVLDQKCLFPRQAKDAAGELKKLGVSDSGAPIPEPPSLDPALSARIERTMKGTA